MMKASSPFSFVFCMAALQYKESMHGYFVFGFSIYR